MKKFDKHVILIVLALVCALVTAIVFLTVSKLRFLSAAFWIAWSFAVPWNLLCATLLHLFAVGGKDDGVARVPVTYAVCGAFCAIYMAIGLIFMYLPVWRITFLLILEIIVTVAYALVVLYALRGVMHIVSSEKHVAQKVLVIRLLKSEVEACMASAKQDAVRSELRKLAEDVRFSDPMSHEQLEEMEKELFDVVYAIRDKIAENADGEETLALIDRAKDLLLRRNQRCQILK